MVSAVLLFTEGSSTFLQRETPFEKRGLPSLLLHRMFPPETIHVNFGGDWLSSFPGPPFCSGSNQSSKCKSFAPIEVQVKHTSAWPVLGPVTCPHHVLYNPGRGKRHVKLVAAFTAILTACRYLYILRQGINYVLFRTFCWAIHRWPDRTWPMAGKWCCPMVEHLFWRQNVPGSTFHYRRGCQVAGLGR